MPQMTARPNRSIPPRPLCLVAGLCLAGCAPARLHSVGSNAPGQYVVRASQYAFTTDFELDQRDPMIRDLVGLRSRVSRELGLPAGQNLVRIVVFENQQRFDEFLRGNFPELPARRAFFVKQHDGELTVFACRGSRLREDLRHEATHALLHGLLPRVPIWLDEGLAEYFESDPATPGWQPDHVARLARETRSERPLELARLERLHTLWQMTPADYRESWFWIHFCLHHSQATRTALLDHLTALRAGHPGSLEARLRAVEPNYPSAAREHLDRLSLGTG